MSRFRRGSALVAAASAVLLSPVAVLAAPASAAPAAIVNEPPGSPVSIIAFPSRDFVSTSGFQSTDLVDVSVIRNGRTVATARNQVPQSGLVEINHPGGGCWDGDNPAVTPELRPGDVVRTVAHDANGAVRTTDQTRTANVTAGRPITVTPASSATSRDGVVQIHGTAVGADGGPLPVSQIEERLIANRDAFDLNGVRTLRAGGAGTDGTLSYDSTSNPLGVNWTATYSGLSSDDVARAVGGTSASGTTFAGAESRILWLGANPLSGQEVTIFENGSTPGAVTGGPAAGVTGCTSGPLEAPDSQAPSVPTNVRVAASGADETVTWSASSDDSYVAGYRVFRDGQPVGNVGGSYATPGDSSSAFSTTTSFTDRSVPPGQHVYTVAAYDNASPLGPGATPVDQLASGIGTPYGNLSPQSAGVPVTQADVTAPSVPGNVQATVSGGQDVALSWNASTDDAAVTGYGVYRRAQGATAWIKIGDAPGTTFSDPALPLGKWEYAVDATDAAGNRSAKSNPPTLVVSTNGPDQTAPDVVTGVTASNSPDIHGKDVAISWTAGKDNVAVTGYGVYRNGQKIADVAGSSTTFTDKNLAAGTYGYTVDAVDSAGNRSAASASASVVVANDPPVAPHDLIAFPARDFISATGYTPGTAYTFSVIRGGKTAFTSTPVVADSTGLAEVNHPGGACWNTTTPNLVPGDVVRITGGGISEQTTVAGVTDERPIVTAVDATTGGGTVQVHGTAQDGAGKPLPIDQIEQRLIANRDLFDVNGRRTIRAGAGLDGTLAYDAAGSTHWTATYTFTTPNDLARAVGGTSTSGTAFTGAESRVLWLGRSPLAPVESTIFENGPGVVGGPAAVTGCTSGAAEAAPGAALSAAPTFPVTSPGSASTAQTVTLTNNGPLPLHVDHAYLAGLNPADYTITANSANGATVTPGASVSVSVAFTPGATVSGQRQANLSFMDDAANTTDQTVPLVASTPASPLPTATAPVQSLAAGQNLAVNSTLPNSTIAVGVKWTGTGARSELQLATGASTSSLGAFAPVTLSPDTATSTTVPLKLGNPTGNAYQFQVRSCNGTTCGAWVPGPKFTVVPSDDKTMPASSWKGTWTAENLTGSYGGTVKWATGGSATLLPAISYTVSGNAAWVSTLGPDRGLAQVQVDGTTPQVVDLYSPTVQPARVVWSQDALPAGTHTVTVTPLGKKSTLNPSACTTGTKCARVDVDGSVMIK